MKWAEELAARSPSLAGGEGAGEGGSGGVTGAEDAHHVVAGRILVGEAVSVGDRGRENGQAGEGLGAQQGERQSFVGLSGKKLVPNNSEQTDPCAGVMLTVDICAFQRLHCTLYTVLVCRQTV